MGQKSLHSLHRIDTSMIWESYLNNLNYKWLSYNLWFTYIYYYKFISFSLTNHDIIWNNAFELDHNRLISDKTWKYKKYKHVNIRFSYHIELYCVEFLNYLLLINIYFLTNLKFYKKKKKHYIDKKSLAKIANIFK